MTTAFLWKNKYIRVVAVFLTVLFSACICLYAAQLKNAETAGKTRTFYYLVSDETHMQAGAYFTEFNGGAGYLLTHKDKSYTAYAVYLSEEKARQARQAVVSVGDKVSVLSVTSTKLYFKSKSQKENAKIYLSALDTLYAELGVFYDTVALLDEGKTQESVQRLLQGAARRFSVLASSHEKIYPSFAAVCVRATVRLKSYENETLYAKELRAELCGLCKEYLGLCAEFSL